MAESLGRFFLNPYFCGNLCEKAYPYVFSIWLYMFCILWEREIHFFFSGGFFYHINPLGDIKSPFAQVKII